MFSGLVLLPLGLPISNLLFRHNKDGQVKPAIKMQQPKSPYVTFLESPNQLEVIDQRKLPLTEVKVRLRTVEDVKHAIQTMIVRGAPVRIAPARTNRSETNLRTQS